VRHPLCRAAGLLQEEVIALRLYSGPMYVLYNNGVLRARARGKYVTTIHAINSGCLKLSRMQRACTVWYSQQVERAFLPVPPQLQRAHLSSPDANSWLWAACAFGNSRSDPDERFPDAHQARRARRRASA